MSNSVFQSVIVQLKEVTDRVFGVQTSGSTTVAVNQITEMQPITYAPAEDLVFAENFDVCVYGSDIVTYRNSGTTGMSRGRTPTAKSTKRTSGKVCDHSDLGLSLALFYTDSDTEQTDCAENSQLYHL